MNKPICNFEPINPIDLAKSAGVTVADVLKFFEREFGGLDEYVSACANREELGRVLARLNGDKT